MLKKAIHITLILAILISTTGFTLHKHYCMGRVMSLAVNHEAASCTDLGTEDPMPCCDDVSQVLKVHEITQVSFDFDSTPQLYQLALIEWFSVDFSLEITEEEAPQSHYYLPPPPSHDLLVEYQVFLI